MTGQRSPAFSFASNFSWTLLLKLVGLLFTGFLLLQTAVADQLSNFVATGLAALAGTVLQPFHGDIIRTGVELRSSISGHALLVTEACDGLGISIVLLAVLLALSSQNMSWRSLIVAALAGFLVVQGFNLFRIVLLYEMLPAGSWGFGFIHFEVFPFLSAVLVASLVLAFWDGRRWPLWLPAAWFALAALVGLAWSAVSPTVSGIIFVPIANFLLTLWPGQLVDAISVGPGEVYVLTNLLTSLQPPKIASLPFAPEAFTLGLPLIAVSLLLAKTWARNALILSPAALFVMALAMAVAAHNSAQNEAVNTGLDRLVVGNQIVSYAPPREMLRAVAAALQNTLVYFNLFILPFVAFFRVGSPKRRPQHG